MNCLQNRYEKIVPLEIHYPTDVFKALLNYPETIFASIDEDIPVLYMSSDPNYCYDDIDTGEVRLQFDFNFSNLPSLSISCLYSNPVSRDYSEVNLDTKDCFKKNTHFHNFIIAAAKSKYIMVYFEGDYEPFLEDMGYFSRSQKINSSLRKNFKNILKYFN